VLFYFYDKNGEFYKLTQFFFFLISFPPPFLSINFDDLFCLFSIRLFQPHNWRISLNRLTWVDSSYFLCYLLIRFFFQFLHSTLSRSGTKLHNLSQFALYWDILVSRSRLHVLIFLPWLNQVVLFLFFFSKRLSRSYDSDHGSFSNGFAFYWIVPISWLMP